MRRTLWLCTAFGAFAFIAAGGAHATIIHGTGGDGTDLATIDTATALGSTVGSSGFTQTWSAAFDNNTGSLYTVVNGFSANKQLGIYNLATGAVTLVGSPMGLGTNLIALEVANDGTMYAGDWVGNFYTIDKDTGLPTFIGFMGAGLTDLMDLAFDSTGTLWATVNNNLWTVNTSTGAATLQGNMTGIVGGSVMGIMFDVNDTLYATGYDPVGQLYIINTTTLNATFQGNTNLFFPHGGDILLPVSVLPVSGPATLTLLLLSLGLAGLAYQRRKVA